ncbi:Bug family tripartite tricarboxylate transporter substrate binding protein [Siccirubricoccus deserti]|uniref:Tripartite tricarboxylate transporter substrate binding protein n=1 Tax=Siccirubricoccus deserti TaxID=2013562 RepID=A0A9X0UG98_9PROT|nr:tripartite tricarboxylate transporter substrate binding protein [Siccirubricoccus deserti]MBC4018703.1 tripartite tricarboxylate transporter substrate binding protein [Siccirubricoccus deserti]
MTHRVREAGGLARRSLFPALGALAVAGRNASADTYPGRPIRFIVGFPAGNSTDLTARIVAEALRVRLGQPVVVENRPGANGSLGATAVATAAPDGHTLLISNASTMTVNHLLYRENRYHPLRDLLPIATITASPFIITINPSNPRTRGVRTLQDFVALSKARPGTLSFGSPGNGNLGHLGFELLNHSAGMQLLHVPYRGAALAQNALVASEVDACFDTPAAIPLVRSGVLAAIACSGPERWRDLPEVPTLVESGYPDAVITFWNALVAPANTPPPIVQALYQAVEAVSREPATRQLLMSQGEVVVLDPVGFRERIAGDIDKNAMLIRRIGLEAQ